MFDIITLGTAAQDIFLNVNFLKKQNNLICIEPGKKWDIERPFIQTGGGATNTAVAFSRLGFKTGIIARIGNDDAGHIIQKTAREEHIDLKFLQKDKHEGTAFSVILTKENEDRTIFTYRGASQKINLKEITLNQLNTKWLYISGLRGDSIEVLEPILRYAKQKKIQVAMNPGSQELEKRELLKYVDVLIVNKEEAEKIAGVKADSLVLLKKIKMLGPKIIAVTNGKEKIYIADESRTYSSLPYDVEVKNTLGAGDAFGSGFVAAVMQNKTMEEAIIVANLNASSVIQHVGAKIGLLYKSQVKKYKEQRKIVKIKEEN
ncbi:carbohydrate kinase family protein [Candidatus Woesearchaeota archaeon]|nr:carbohydrate kinase family protein [Candidatus Woesearchaeota archaeon]